jgi:Cu+-exporting ATPase
VEGRALLIGTARLMAAEGVALPEALTAAAAAAAAQGQTPVFVAVDGQAAGLMAVADRIKPTARATVAALQAKGLRVVLITGDAQATARTVAAELGIDEVRAEVLPGDKAAAVRALRDAGPVAFVGDGINDAPALAEADVGIALGTGTDIAIEAADVVLVSGDPAGVVNALHVARAVLRNIRQNLIWAFGYNAALIPVAAGVLWPGVGILLSPVLAAGAMSVSSVSVLTNALRLRRLAPPMAPQNVGGRGPSQDWAAGPAARKEEAA